MTLEQAVAWAESQVGVTEWPPGSNTVKFWQMWQDGTEQTYGHDGLPWCGAFVWVACHAGGWNPPAVFIGVPEIAAWARAHGRWRNGSAGIARGDLVVMFGYAHTGIATGSPGPGGQIPTVEGNTSAGADGSQANGGGVFRRLRSPANVTGYVRVADLFPAPPPPRPPDGPPPAVPDTTEALVPKLPHLTTGSSGDAVRTWQGLLLARGHSTIKVDGKFGRDTLTATVHLQQLHKLTADGAVDAATWTAGLAL